MWRCVLSVFETKVLKSIRGSHLKCLNTWHPLDRQRACLWKFPICKCQERACENPTRITSKNVTQSCNICHCLFIWSLFRFHSLPFSSSSSLSSSSSSSSLSSHSLWLHLPHLCSILGSPSRQETLSLAATTPSSKPSSSALQHCKVRCSTDFCQITSVTLASPGIHVYCRTKCHLTVSLVLCSRCIAPDWAVGLFVWF